jgi:hypothetical protein
MKLVITTLAVAISAIAVEISPQTFDAASAVNVSVEQAELVSRGGYPYRRHDGGSGRREILS